MRNILHERFCNISPLQNYMEPQGGDINHLSCKSKVMGLILHSSCQMRPPYPSSYDLSCWWDIEQEYTSSTERIFLPFFDFGPAWVGPCTVKPVLRGHSKRRPKLIFTTNYRLIQVKSIAECSFCNTFDLH